MIEPRRPKASPARTSKEEPRSVLGTQALMRGIDVLMAIGMATEPPRFRDLSLELGIAKGTLHRLLAGLQARNLVRYDARTRRYHVGHRIFDLARHTLDQSEIHRATKPEVTRLSRQLRRPICLYVLEDEHVFVLDFEDPDAAQARTVRIWPRLPVQSSAPGLTMIAAFAPEDRARFVAEDDHSLTPDLGLARALGYAVRKSEDGGQSQVAAAITDRDGTPVAAIACQFDAFTGTAEELHSAGRMIAEGARRASRNFGATHTSPSIRPRPPASPPDRLVNLGTGRDFMGENPIWCHRRKALFWLDILAPALRIYHPETQRAERIMLPEVIGGLSLREDGGFILLGQRGIFSLDHPDGEIRLIISPESNKPDNRFNTAAVDDGGAIWAATMAIDQRPGEGSLYRISSDFEVRRFGDKFGLAKNVAFAPDRSALYISDGHSGVIYRYRHDPLTHEIDDRIALVTGGDETGFPNGIAVDAEGFVWAAMLGGWAINRYAPDATLDQSISMPVPMPTAVGFGGEDMKTLFVTSTYLRLPAGYSASAPLSGQLFALPCDVAGQPGTNFGTGR